MNHILLAAGNFLNIILPKSKFPEANLQNYILLSGTVAVWTIFGWNGIHVAKPTHNLHPHCHGYSVHVPIG